MVLYYVICSGWPFPTNSSSRYSLRALDSPLVSPFFATLTNSSQLHDNTTTLSPAFAALTRRVKPKSFVCHSYKKHRGWGVVEQASACFPFLNSVANDPEFLHLSAAPNVQQDVATSFLLAPLPPNPLSPVEATLTKRSVTVDSKPLPKSLKPLNATLTRKWGAGPGWRPLGSRCPTALVTSLLLYVVPFHLAVHCLLRRGPLGQTHPLRRHRHPESRRWSHYPDGWLRPLRHTGEPNRRGSPQRDQKPHDR